MLAPLTLALFTLLCGYLSLGCLNMAAHEATCPWVSHAQVRRCRLVGLFFALTALVSAIIVFRLLTA